MKNNSKEKVTEIQIKKKDVLYNADPNCKHETEIAPGGGIKCTKCSGWFCY